MDHLLLGHRIAQAREIAGMTQEVLGTAVSLDRTAITRLEKGERKLSVPELVVVAKALGRPLSFFVSAPVPAVVSRRRDTAHAHASTLVLEVELEQFAADVRTLLEMELLDGSERDLRARVPRDHNDAERLAGDVRRRLALGDQPIHDLGETCERLGLCTYVAPLGGDGPDGGCVEVSDAPRTFGAAVINGDSPAGRRRMTLAHELGHWLTGDAYDLEASTESERMINSFAIHFLAPRAGVLALWNGHMKWTLRDRSLAIGASFRLSWSAVLGQLGNLGLITQDERRVLSANEPRAGDYARLGLSWRDELSPPYVSPNFAAGCLNGYLEHRLTTDRALELLRGTLAEEDLPIQDDFAADHLRRAFAGHDA